MPHVLALQDTTANKWVVMVVDNLSEPNMYKDLTVRGVKKTQQKKSKVHQLKIKFEIKIL